MSPNPNETWARAGLTPSSDATARLQAALATSNGEDDLLELSHARWGNEENGPDEVLVVLLRDRLVLVGSKRRLLGGAQSVVMSKPFSAYTAVGSDDEFFGHSVFLHGHDEDDTFLLNWPNAGERDRMFKAIFHAHGGNYAPWGLQLDPANYEEDFNSFYAEVVAEGPAETGDWYGWVEQRYGDFDVSNALGLALDWRHAELSDAAGREPSERVGRIGFSGLWADNGPQARRVIVRLGEGLADDGLLEPPYDEETFKTGEGLSQSDAGPARLIALMTLGAYAKSLGHPRAEEWIGAARRGISSVPPSVFFPSLRDLWADIEELPRG